jgi:hypothetical protein
MGDTAWPGRNREHRSSGYGSARRYRRIRYFLCTIYVRLPYCVMFKLHKHVLPYCLPYYGQHTS